MQEKFEIKHIDNASLPNDTGLTVTTSTSRTMDRGDTCSFKDEADLFSSKRNHSNKNGDGTDGSQSSDEEMTLNTVNHEEEEKRITSKIDYHMMPLLCIFYFVDFLDRQNIGNAKLAGIQNDLNLTSSELSLTISGFYITYILFEVPSNIILKRWRPIAWLSIIMFFWGTMTLVMAFSTNFASLLACRLLLGAAESGYIPGILYILSKIYRHQDFGLRVAVLLCMSSISGIVSGPIAYGTSFLDGEKGLQSWQYLFILEGVPTICLSVVCYFCLYDDIQAVSWLTDSQKKLHKRCTNAPDEEAPMTLQCFIKALWDWKTILFSLTYFLTVINLTSHQIFLPTIIDGFGFGVLESQLLSAPPNVVQTICIILGGYFSDKYANKRGILMVVGFSIGAIGYMLLLVLHSPWALYGALFIIPAGLGFQAPSSIGWSAINYPCLEVRVVAVAIVVMIGNSGGVVASFLYPLNDTPHYYFGNTFNLCCSISGALCSALTSYLLLRQNRKWDNLQEIANASDDENKQTKFRYYC